MANDDAGRVALVTGSGKDRIGRDILRALAGRGVAAAIHYRTSAEEAAEGVAELRKLGVEADAFRADLGDEDEVRTLVADVQRRFGRIDVLVNAAAIWDRKRLEDVTAADVRAHFEANVLGTFLVARAVGLRMVEQSSGGCIVNFGDWAEARPRVDDAAYFATKGAIPTLTRSLAVELGERNPKVRVNAVLPGPVIAPPDLSPEEQQARIDAALVRMEGDPAHVTLAVLALIDNPFLTGVCLPVDGGRTIFAGRD